MLTPPVAQLGRQPVPGHTNVSYFGLPFFPSVDLGMGWDGMGWDDWMRAGHAHGHGGHGGHEQGQQLLYSGRVFLFNQGRSGFRVPGGFVGQD